MIKFLRHGLRRFEPRDPIGPASWPHHDLIFVHSGAVELEFPSLRKTITVTRGTGVLVWPKTRFHGRIVGASARISIQHFRVAAGAPWIFAPLQGQEAGFTVQGAAPSAWLQACVARAQELAREQAIWAESHDTRCALLALILTEGGYVRRGKPAAEPARLDVVKLGDWLRAHLHRNPGIPEMARECALSPSRFRTVFLREHGRSAGKFLLKVRAVEAERMLVETKQPVKAVAAALGYADVVVFHRAFKRHAGTTPHAFRRQHRAEG